MFKNLFKKSRESCLSILPIAILVVLVCLTVVNVETSLLVKFLICSLMLILGMGLFNLGADMSMISMGEGVGYGLTKSKKLSLMIISAIIIGFIITVAEPDLAILAFQSPFNKWIFIGCVSLGVGLFLALAVLRIIFQFKLSVLLIISYSIIFLIAIIFPTNYLAIAFDSGSVTTGTMSVPFLLAFGLGLSSLRNSNNSKDDGFGLIALASVGPILSFMVLTLILQPNATPVASTIDVSTWNNMLPSLLASLWKYVKEVFLLILPLVAVFFVFQFSMLKWPKIKIKKILIGLLYTFVGIVLFLTGVNSAYLPIANAIGTGLVEGEKLWLLYPLALLIGYFIIYAEPAVHVLKKQIQVITGGAIKQRTIAITLACGSAIAVLLAVLRAVFNIPFLAIILPLYVVAVALSVYTPELFSAVSFDAGGTAAGAMAVSFVLPLISGVSTALGNNYIISSFGSVALIAIVPVLSVEILGCIHKYVENRVKKKRIKINSGQIKIIDFIYKGEL